MGYTLASLDHAGPPTTATLRRQNDLALARVTRRVITTAQVRGGREGAGQRIEGVGVEQFGRGIG